MREDDDVTERTVAEQAAELARTLPETSTLQIRYGSKHDRAAEDATGFEVLRPDGTVTYWLNGEEISKELHDALVPIFEASRERARRDPRWNWVEVVRFGQDPAHPDYVKGTCRHIELEPVNGQGTVERPLYKCGTCGAHLQTVARPGEA